MPDEFDIVHLSEDEGQEIINWAVAAAGMVLLMDALPDHTNGAEAEERIKKLMDGVDIMLENMPEQLRASGAALANDRLAEAVEEEQQVEEFRKELDEL